MVTIGVYTTMPFFMSLRSLLEQVDYAVNYCGKDERKEVLTNAIHYIKISSILYL